MKNNKIYLKYKLNKFKDQTNTIFSDSKVFRLKCSQGILFFYFSGVLRPIIVIHIALYGCLNLCRITQLYILEADVCKRFSFVYFFYFKQQLYTQIVFRNSKESSQNLKINFIFATKSLQLCLTGISTSSKKKSSTTQAIT